MKEISIKSKRAQNWLMAYNASRCYSVTVAYARPSSRKISIDRELQKQCLKNGGCCYKIIAAGTCFFTAAWITRDGNLRVETAFNSYIIKL